MPIIHTGSTARPAPEIARALMEFEPDDQLFIADRVMRPVGSLKQDGKLLFLRREDFTRNESTEVAAGATYGRGNFRTKSTSFSCVKYGQEAAITDEDRQNYKDAFDAELIAAKRAYSSVLIDREVRVKDAIFNTSTWTGAALYTDVSGAPWDAAASDAIGHIQAAIEKVRAGTGVYPNALICSSVTVNNLLLNTALIARFPGAQAVTRKMLLDNLMSMFHPSMKYLIEGGGVYNSAIEGQDFSGADIWSDDYAMIAKVAVTDDPAEAAVARTVVWSGLMGMPDNILDTSVYREEQSDSDIVKVRNYVDEIVVDAAFGHLLKVDA